MQEKMVVNIMDLMVKPSLNISQSGKSLDNKNIDEFEQILNNVKNVLEDETNNFTTKDMNSDEIIAVISEFLNFYGINNIDEESLKEMLNSFDLTDDSDFDFQALKELLLNNNKDLNITNDKSADENNEVISLFNNYLYDNGYLSDEVEISEKYFSSEKIPIHSGADEVVKKDNSNKINNNEKKEVKLNNDIPDNKISNNKIFNKNEIFKNNNVFDSKINKNLSSVSNKDTNEKLSGLKKNVEEVVKFEGVSFKVKENISDKLFQNSSQIQSSDIHGLELKSTANIENSDNLEIKKNSDILKIADFIEIAKTGNKTKLTVQLSPAELGKINIQLHEADGKISAKIFVETDHTKSLLVHHSDAIKNQLSEKGIVIDNMDFEFMDDASTNQNSFANGKQHQNSKQFEFDSHVESTSENKKNINNKGRLYA